MSLCKVAGSAALAALVAMSGVLANELASPAKALPERLARIMGGDVELDPLGFEIGERLDQSQGRMKQLLESSSSAIRQELVYEKKDTQLKVPQRFIRYVFTLQAPYQGTFALSYCDASPGDATPDGELQLQVIRYGYRLAGPAVDAAVAQIGARAEELKKDHRYYVRTQEASASLTFVSRTERSGAFNGLSSATLSVGYGRTPEGGLAADGSGSERYEAGHVNCTAAAGDIPMEHFRVTEQRLR
ncbi:MAG: hypothetical protein RLZ98_306 [Pseudomonadota bacterium]|jgi:hypothetical protein